MMPTHYQGNPQQVLALDTFIKLTRAADTVMAALQHGGTFGSLTVTQFGTLESLYHLGPMCQNEIGAKLLKSSGNLSLVLANLEKARLITRERDPADRRRVIVRLTPAGEALIAERFVAHAAAITSALSVLDAEEQETLGRLCRKLGTSLA